MQLITWLRAGKKKWCNIYTKTMKSIQFRHTAVCQGVNMRMDNGKNLTDFSVTLMKSSFYDALISAMFIFQSMHIYTEHFALKF